jgi:predicted TPR repeat methyltransferase
MSEFDARARSWDQNPGHLKRAEAVAADIKAALRACGLLERPGLRGLEYGAGTGTLGLLLRDVFAELIMMDASREMVRVMEEKCRALEQEVQDDKQEDKQDGSVADLHPVFVNLEQEAWTGAPVDVAFALMVMHHVGELELVLRRLYNLLDEEGCLIVVDLQAEDGSFHGEDFDGHLGFEPERFSALLKDLGFTRVDHHICYIMEKETAAGLREFPLVMWVAAKEKKVG